MRPRSPKTLNARAAARVFLAAVLTFAVTASAVPFGSVFGAHGCSMPCCRDADGKPGDCKGGSCPISHFGKPKPAKPAPAKPSCHTDGDASSSHDGAAGAHHAEPAHDSSHEPDVDRIKHSPHGDVSPRDTSTRAAMAIASLSKPCPPDCGGVLNSFTQLRRGRDAAALSHKLRPRPPGVEVRSLDTAGVVKNTTALRRQYPPRAPPSVPSVTPV